MFKLKVYLIFYLIVFSLSISSACADLPEAGNSIIPSSSIVASTGQEVHPIYKEKLKNGLTVIIKKVPENIVAIDIFVKTGVMNETRDNAGISNLVQSLLLRGTKLRSAKDITFDIESVGGMINSSGSPDYSEYFVQCTSDYTDVGLDVISDVIQHPLFSEESIAEEKTNIYTQMEALRTKPFLTVYELFNERLYQRHPYGRPSLGYRNTIEKLTRDDILNFYKKNYVAKNIVISIVGNVDKTHVMERLNALFASLPSTDPPELNNPDEPKPLLWREEFRMNDSDSAWIFLGYLGPSISSKDYPAMEILELIIGGGMNSRMWVNLREKKGLAYDLGAFVNPTIGNGHMVTYIVTDPGKVQEVKKAILYEVEDMRKGKFTAEELDTMKNFKIGQYYINEETVKNQAFNLGLYETLGVGYEFYLKYPELIQNITKDDICRVAKYYLDNPVIVVLSPRKPDI